MIEGGNGEEIRRRPDFINERRKRIAYKGAADELSRKVRELKTLATTDSLTNLLNRRGFKQLAEKVFAGIKKRKLADINNLEQRAEDKVQERRMAVIVMIDLDDFKTEVNDRLGHDAGDEVLRRVSAYMEEHVRDVDTVGRWGGEEFIMLILLEEGISSMDIKKIVEEKQEGLTSLEINFQGQSIPITASFGVADTSDFDSFDDVRQAADISLYEAKGNGKNQVTLFSEIPEEKKEALKSKLAS